MKTIFLTVLLLLVMPVVSHAEGDVVKYYDPAFYKKVEELEKRVKYLEDRIGKYYKGAEKEPDVMIQERQLRNNPGYRLPPGQDASDLMTGSGE